MALGIVVSAAPASGSQVFRRNFGSAGPVRLYVKANGGALTAALVTMAPTESAPDATIDSTTFASLGSGVTKSLLIERPVSVLGFTPDSAGGVTVDCWVDDSIGG